jgi:hypothetical protein
MFGNMIKVGGNEDEVRYPGDKYGVKEAGTGWGIYDDEGNVIMDVTTYDYAIFLCTALNHDVPLEKVISRPANDAAYAKFKEQVRFTLQSTKSIFCTFGGAEVKSIKPLPGPFGVFETLMGIDGTVAGGSPGSTALDTLLSGQGARIGSLEALEGFMAALPGSRIGAPDGMTLDQFKGFMGELNEHIDEIDFHKIGKALPGAAPANDREQAFSEFMRRTKKLGKAWRRRDNLKDHVKRNAGMFADVINRLPTNTRKVMEDMSPAEFDARIEAWPNKPAGW